MKNNELSILFSGDFCPRAPVSDLIKAGKSKLIMQEILPLINKSDLSIINLETCLTRKKYGKIKDGPNIGADPGVLDFITESGFDIASLANNHTGDFGPAEFLKTCDLVKNKNIKITGAGTNLNEAKKPLLICKNNLKIAILNFTENEFGIAEKEIPGAAPIDPADNILNIQKTSAKNDKTIVIIHGGNELNPLPNPWSVKLYRAFAEAGADAVIAAHTHCPQPFEIYKGIPIVYSMGNFLFPSEQTDNPAWFTGYLSRIILDKTKKTKLEIIPYSFTPNADKIKLLKNNNKSDFMNYLNKTASIITDDITFHKYWDAWSAIMGPDLFNRIQRSNPVIKSDADFGLLMIARNVLTCESHRETLKNYFNIIENKRLKSAEKYIPKLRALQKFPLKWIKI